jgi:hypothetical protein
MSEENDVAVSPGRKIPRIQREEIGSFRAIGEYRRYSLDLRGKDPNELKQDPRAWRSTLLDIASLAPDGAERWSFGRSSGANGHYFVKYYKHK